MPGPENPTEAGGASRGGQYVTVPGFAAPGPTYPTNSRTAQWSTVVYSPKGWKWEEVNDNYSLAVSKVANAAIEASVRAMRTTFGQVYYIKGTEATIPPFSGEAVGDTCRVQDAITNDIVSEWRWTGDVWERMQVDNQQISNLDVGKLTAGSASINELAARKIASDVGRFLELTTDQLTVTGNASFTDVVARNIWTRVITAQQGEFEQVHAGMLAANSVTADNIQVGALDGQVITGAVIQTDKRSSTGIRLSEDGLSAYNQKGERTIFVNARNGNVDISGRLGYRDTWSECFFSNVVWSNTGTDVDGEGGSIGAGLAFRSIKDEWQWGVIAIGRDPDSTPFLLLRSPIRNSTGAFGPSITLKDKFFEVGISGIKNNHNGMLRVTNDFLWGKVFGWELRLGGSVTGFCDSHGSIVIGNSGATTWLATGPDKNVGVWAHATNGVGLVFANKRSIWVDAQGAHIGGSKKFTMPVPKLTKAKGGMQLDHSATESPYDGIEYWENVQLDGDGKAVWVLPNYVPLIASKKAPWVVFTSSGAAATLDRSDDTRWVVNVSGHPGETVAVLVKGARMIAIDDGADGEPIMRDYARESLWTLPPDIPKEGVSEPVLGGGFYGPAPKPKEYDEHRDEQAD